MPNLERAYLMRSDEERRGVNAVNSLWLVIKENFNVLHDYTKHVDWVKVRPQNQKELCFPPIKFDYIPNDVYSNLEFNHIYWFRMVKDLTFNLNF